MSDGDDDPEVMLREFLGPLYAPVEPEGDNAGDPGAIDEKQRRIEIEARAQSAFWHRCLSDATGRRELYRLIERCGAFGQPFPANLGAREAAWFALGARAIGDYLRDLLSIYDRANFFLMLDEHDPRYVARREFKHGE